MLLFHKRPSLSDISTVPDASATFISWISANDCAVDLERFPSLSAPGQRVGWLRVDKDDAKQSIQ